MGLHTARIPENLEEYVSIIVAKGYADSFGSAINLIILDRMIHDREKGTVTPFVYRLKDGRKNPDKGIMEIETDNIEPPSLPLREPPATGGPDPGRFARMTTNQCERGADGDAAARHESCGISAKASAGTGLPKMEKPVYPGTKAEYEKALEKGEIKRDMFAPPEE